MSEIEFRGDAPRKPVRIGTVQTIGMDTGEVVEEQRNAMTLLPPAGDVCQECAVAHDHDQPHNQQSLYYQQHFHATHGRWPTWSDAMAHCPPEVQKLWREQLVIIMKAQGVDVPLDLLDESPAKGR